MSRRARYVAPAIAYATASMTGGLGAAGKLEANLRKLAQDAQEPRGAPP
jgi:hypothetical protein